VALRRTPTLEASLRKGQGLSRREDVWTVV
jgi:hypothetical protein